MLEVSLNGERRQVAPGTTLASLLASVGVEASQGGVAAALDGAVVPRARWSSVVLEPGAEVEVIRATAGG